MHHNLIIRLSVDYEILDLWLCRIELWHFFLLEKDAFVIYLLFLFFPLKLFLHLSGQKLYLLHDLMQLLFCLVIDLIDLLLQHLNLSCFLLMDVFEVDDLFYLIFVDFYHILILFFLLGSDRTHLFLYHLVLRFAALIFGWVKKLKPIQQLWSLSYGPTILGVADCTVIISINLHKFGPNLLFIYSDVAVNKTTPMLDDLREILVKLYEWDRAVSTWVHESETKLITLILGAVLQDIHNSHELVELQATRSSYIEYFKHSVGQKRVLLLS